ncbi:MAG: peptidylprolyl isomerase [Epulopiscium sp. Nele67-Bin001]|nr:MAG: peptidylprolyl isomerase [Epulopiscium sp. Nuni2H_MBin001]OON90513.1 MAG: peptidylprolyl isomerase [Epulopiscium sp. Nele67-Bin001]
MSKPIVTMSIKDYGDIIIELYPDIAPNTVSNFVSLIEAGYYNGLTFHRIIDGFMIQGGCPLGTGSGNPGYSIKGEFTANGVENNLAHTLGVISMARSANPDSAGSQFFIMTGTSPHLDGEYAGFGKVISGLEIVETLGKVATGAGDKPVEDVFIDTVTVDLNGAELVPLQKIEQ